MEPKKVLITTAYHPNFEKRTVGFIILDGVKYSNETQWVRDDREAISISDLDIVLGDLIYEPITGKIFKGSEAYGAHYVYEAELFSEIDPNIFKQILK